MLGEDDARHLGRWVIAQAATDAGINSGGERKTVSPLDQSEAVSFLTSSTGTWRRSRDFWSCLADVDSEDLRERSMQMLGLVMEPEPAPTAPTRVARVDRPAHLPKEGTKQRIVYDLLKRPEGVSIEELMPLLGWKKITCQTVLCSDLPAKFGVKGKRQFDNRYYLAPA